MNKLTNAKRQLSLMRYCYPTALSTDTPRAILCKTLPIRCDLTFTLWKDWGDWNPQNEIVFDAWNSLDAMICGQYLGLGNNWRKSFKRPKWMVALEKQPNGQKHIHGIVQSLPFIGIEKYCRAFNQASKSCLPLEGFVTEIAEPRNEDAWKMYLTKYQDLANQRNTFEFDFQISPNFPPWKDYEM
jgi:hypothetical protein